MPEITNQYTVSNPATKTAVSKSAQESAPVTTHSRPTRYALYNAYKECVKKAEAGTPDIGTSSMSRSELMESLNRVEIERDACLKQFESALDARRP